MTIIKSPEQKKKNAEAVKRYRERHPERIKEAKKKDIPRQLEYNRKRRANLSTWVKMTIPNIKSRAKKNNIEFTISEKDIIVPEFCPVLGIKLQSGICTPIDNSPSVDRFDNNIGYTKYNIRVISHRANQLKRDATIEELEHIILYMKGEL
jgi:hypothetical protein